LIKLFNKYTGGNPRLMVAPTIWAFIENLCTMIPAILGMVSIGFLVSAVTPPFHCDIKSLWKCCIGMVSALLLQLIVSVLSYRFSYYSSQRAMAQMRLGITEKMRNLPLGFYMKTETGELTNTFVTDPDSLEQAMAFYLPQIISMGTLSVISFCMLITYDWRLAVPMYLALPLCLIIMRIAMTLRHKQTEKVRQAKARSSTLLNEYLLGMRNLKSYNQTGSGFSRLDNAYRTLADESTREEGLPGALTLLASHGVSLGIPLIILTASMLLSNKNLNITILLSFLILATRLYSPLATSITSVISLRSCNIAADRVNGFLAEQEQSGQQKNCETGDIEFDGVSFAYGTENVLNDIHIRIPQGRLTALVGPSGSGKSTLLRLACRFWDVQKGKISINGKTISDIEPQVLYEKVSMVFQDSYLFGDTIRNNVLFGSNKSDDEMILACQKACCHDFIMNLPNGYDTVIGEGGATLSGGERQRISIARAIVKDAPILFLDEPTSSLDAENEVLVQRAIDELVKNKTVVMIAHRLRTIAAADNIIVLDKGQVMQAGKHNDLLTQEDGLYYHLWEMQNHTQEWNI